MVIVLANPVLLRAMVVLVCAASAFLIGLLFIRMLRKNITEEGNISANASPSLETLPLHLYNTVIQQLKQQKHALQVQSQAEQHRARTSENFSQAVLSNLSCGVLVFGTNGLARTSNRAAKEILGFASMTGMGAENIFRYAVVRSARSAAPGVLRDGSSNEGESVLLTDEIGAVLREGSQRREVEAEYKTPAGEKRFIAVTVSAVPAVDGGLLGAACLINDRTEMEEMRRQQELQGELSAEMALQLRNSLTTISGYALQLADSRDADLAKQLAIDIAHEAAQLDHSIGGFLNRKHAAQGAAAGSTF
jgi:nitrogen fixation/metabolism regulation signal transduction histidine kinase